MVSYAEALEYLLMLNRIKEFRLVRGLSQNDLAQRTGTSNQMISMLERGKRNLTLQWMARIARALECSMSDLFDTSPNEVSPSEGSLNIPVYGTTVGGSPGTFLLLKEAPIRFIKRPPGIPAGSDVYAFYVIGDNMSPEHRNGDLRFADPQAPIRAGESVLIQMENDPSNGIPSYIRHIKLMDDESYLLEQFNPFRDQRVMAESVISAHPLLNLNKLFGV